MSMNGYLLAITTEQLQALFTGPDAVPAFLFREAGHTESPDYLDLGKDWHALHFLLTGHPRHGEPPLAWAVLGGAEVGKDLGYSSARYLTPEQVARVNAALAALPRELVGTRFSPGAFWAAGINRQDAIDPAAPNETLMQAERNYWSQVYDELATFYREAASQGRAVLKYFR